MVYLFSNFVIVLSLLNVCATDDGNRQSRIESSQWEAWMLWLPCSVTCGVGEQYRYRNCIVPSASAPGCQGNAIEMRQCNTHIVCPQFTVAQWEAWTPWSQCSVTCSEEEQFRYRICTKGTESAQQCQGNSIDAQKCNSNVLCQELAVAHWEAWTPWSQCSVTCSEEEQFRYRICTKSEESAQQCQGNSIDTQKCNSNVLCQELTLTVAQWEAWTPWSQCSVTCSEEEQFRYRICTKGTESAQQCQGNSIDMQKCNSNVLCQVNGSWGNWSAWSSCSVTCGSGNMTRTRSCDNPVPSNGGKTCEGTATESTSCSNETICAVDGSWSNWTTWSSCSVTCGPGNMTRTRLCNNPVPVNGGTPCDGNATESRRCSNETMCAEKPTILSVTSSPPSPVDGNKVILSCNATGNPTPEVHWTYQTDLGFNFVPPTIHYSPNKTQVTIDSYTSTKYGGKWTCFAINSAGSVSLGVHI